MHIVESTSKCRYDAWSCVYVYIGGGLLFFRIHVKGVIEFFCDVGGDRTFCLVVN